MPLNKLNKMILAGAFWAVLIVAPVPWESLKAEVDIGSKVSQMSLDEKVGQLIIAGLAGPSFDESSREMIERYHIGGVNLLTRNIKDRAQVVKLVKDIQTAAAIPLFMAVDQEGGSLSRLKFLKELTPQYNIKTTNRARAVAVSRGKELKALGVNMVFSPVLDYVTDSKSYLWPRAFRGGLSALSNLGAAMAAGYKEAGIAAVPKHFPGYGNVKLDPHANSASLQTDAKGLATSLVSFRRILSAGGADAVMTAHIKAPFFDAKPATVSEKFIARLLRGAWGFDGVVITDDIEMVSSGGSVGPTAVEAVKAGADVIIVSLTPAKAGEAIAALRQAVEQGEISQARLDESVGRILRLKQAYKISNFQ